MTKIDVKRFFFLLFATLAIFLNAAEAEDDKPAGPPASVAAPPDNLPLIRIATCAPADEFIKLTAQAFAQAHPSLRLQVTKMQLSDAAKKLEQNQIDLLVMVSATPSPPSSCILELHKVYIAAVNPDNALQNISLARLKKIYITKIRQWKEIGGPNLPVRLIGYNDDIQEGQLLDILMNGAIPQENTLLRFGTGREIGALVATDSNAIGIFPLEYRSNGIKVLKIDDIAPTAENIENGRYPLIARYYVAAATKLSPQSKPFIEFLKSQEAAQIFLYLSMSKVHLKEKKTK